MGALHQCEKMVWKAAASTGKSAKIIKVGIKPGGPGDQLTRFQLCLGMPTALVAWSILTILALLRATKAHCTPKAILILLLHTQQDKELHAHLSIRPSQTLPTSPAPMHLVFRQR